MRRTKPSIEQNDSKRAYGTNLVAILKTSLAQAAAKNTSASGRSKTGLKPKDLFGTFVSVGSNIILKRLFKSDKMNAK